jgi:hypothetical protein
VTRRACAAALLVTAVAALGAPAAGASPAPRHCRSGDLRYPFQPGGANDFGVFKLRITRGSCATAHRVAKRWMDRFEADLSAGRVRLPRTVLGFRFTTLAPDAAQSYNERGRRGATAIRFEYVVPNG